MRISDDLFEQVDFTSQSVRLIGLSITNLDNQTDEKAFQLSFEFDY